MRCGSPGYIAPEVIKGERCSYNADMFGVAVTIFLLVTGMLPFQGKNQKVVLRQNLRCNVVYEDHLWEGLDACQSLTAALMTPDPAERLTADVALRHPWLHDDSAGLEHVQWPKAEFHCAISRNHLNHL